MTVKNTTATLNEPLQIYRHDRGIILRIQIQRYKYSFNKIEEEDMVAESDILSARAVILKPDGISKIECPRKEIEDNCVIIPITIDWTDEETELGKYKLQIQLYGNDYVNERVTLPPIEFTVAPPICIYPEDGVPGAVMGDALADDDFVISDSMALEDDLENKIYNKTLWVNGDYITSDKLNKVENAIGYLVENQGKIQTIFTPSVDRNGNLSWTNNMGVDNPETVNIRGPRGENGTSIFNIKGSFNTLDQLYNSQSVSRGSTYYVYETNSFYVWIGDDFVDCGNIKGPAGETGPQGPQGVRGLQGPQGLQGNPGAPFTYEDLTTEQKEDLQQGFITCSDNIKRIEVVTSYPSTLEDDVLYIKVSE